MIPVGTSIEAREFPAAVTGIIVANVGLFVLMSLLPAADLDAFIRHYALVPARYTAPALVRLDPLDPLPLLVNLFLHGSVIHLLVNMWTLWLFGRVLEDHMGTWRFLVLYVAGGLAADIAHVLTNFSSPVPALGASGAVAAVMAAVVVLHPRSRIILLVPIGFFPLLIPLPVLLFGVLWFGLQILQGLWLFMEPQGAGGIAWWAHVGGFVAGPALAGVLGVPGHRPRVIGGERSRLKRIGYQRIHPVKQSPPRGRRSVFARRSGAAAPVPDQPDSAGPPPSRKTAVPITTTDGSPRRRRRQGAVPAAGPAGDRTVWKNSTRD